MAKIAYLITNEIFSENKVNSLDPLLEADYVFVASRYDVVVNMAKVNFLVKDDNAVTFVFNDNTRLIVYKSGEVVFVPSGASSEVISPPPEPGQNNVLSEEE